MRSSDDSSNGLQVTFNAGPKGGGHGHLDYLNFELYGYGKALIADPGPWAYDNSPERAYALSTPSNVSGTAGLKSDRTFDAIP